MKISTIFSVLIFLLLSGFYTSGMAQSKHEKKGDKLMDKYFFLAATDAYFLALEDGENTDIVKQKLANCYMKLNNPELTAKWYGEIIDNNDIIKPIDRYNYAMALTSIGDIEEAKKWFEAYTIEVPDDERSESFIEQLDNINEFYANSNLTELKTVPFNSVTSDFSPAFYKNGIVFVSARNLGKEVYKWNESAYLDLYFCNIKSFEMFGNPAPFQKKINTNYHEGPVSFYDKDTKMALTRNNYDNGKLGKSSSGVTKLKIYFTEPGVDGSWSKVEPFDYNSDDYSIGHPTVKEDGSMMYFVSDMPGGFGGTDVYVSVFEHNQWSKPQNLGDKVNTEGNEMFPFLAAEGQLYFSSNGHGGLGGLDVFAYDFEKHSLRNLGDPLNSTKDDFGFIIDEYGNGFISSNRDSKNGNDNIYQFSSVKSILIDTRVLVIDMDQNQPLPNASVSVSEVGNDSTWVSYTGDDGYLTTPMQLNHEYEIVASKEGFSTQHKNLIPVSDSEKVLMKLESNCLVVKGKARVSEGEANAGSVLVIFENKKDQSVDSAWVVQDQYFEFCMDTQTDYHIKVKKESYFTKSVSFSSPDNSNLELAEIVLDKIVLDKAIKIDNIYYDVSKWDIRPDAAKELDIIASLLDDNPTIQIELSSHTDSRGSDPYNLSLSQKRAKSAAEYIISQGIESYRIQAKGYGEIELINNCANGVNCSSEEHQENRRTEFKVLKY